MSKTKVGRRDRLSVNIYRKKDNRAGLVFKYKGRVYRITTVLGYTKLLEDLGNCIKRGSRIVQLLSPRGRKWAIEAVSGAGDAGRAMLLVWELMPAGESLVRFAWQGTAKEINAVFEPFY